MSRLGIAVIIIVILLLIICFLLWHCGHKKSNSLETKRREPPQRSNYSVPTFFFEAFKDGTYYVRATTDNPFPILKRFQLKKGKVEFDKFPGTIFEEGKDFKTQGYTTLSDLTSDPTPHEPGCIYFTHLTVWRATGWKPQITKLNHIFHTIYSERTLEECLRNPEAAAPKTEIPPLSFDYPKISQTYNGMDVYYLYQTFGGGKSGVVVGGTVIDGFFRPNSIVRYSNADTKATYIGVHTYSASIHKDSIAFHWHQHPEHRYHVVGSYYGYRTPPGDEDVGSGFS